MRWQTWWHRMRAHVCSSKLMTAVEVVRYLMEENGLTQVDLAPLFGGQSRVSDFLAGKRSLSKGRLKAV